VAVKLPASHSIGINDKRTTIGWEANSMIRGSSTTGAASTLAPTRSRRVSRAIFIGFFGLLLFNASGCPDEREKTRTEEVVGTIEEIDLKNRRVKVRAYLEKHETYQTFEVQVTDDTEILINGALANMEDARVGERAEGTIRITRNEGKSALTAIAVKIERGEVLSAPGADDDPDDEESETEEDQDDALP